MSQTTEWNEFLAEYGGGNVVSATVTKVLPFGALLEAAPGIHGLLSQADWVVEPRTGSTVSVRIANIDVERRE
jgi:small subunit ribosomal protein S1